MHMGCSKFYVVMMCVCSEGSALFHINFYLTKFIQIIMQDMVSDLLPVVKDSLGAKIMLRIITFILKGQV